MHASILPNGRSDSCTLGSLLAINLGLLQAFPFLLNGVGDTLLCRFIELMDGQVLLFAATPLHNVLHMLTLLTRYCHQAIIVFTLGHLLSEATKTRRLRVHIVVNDDRVELLRFWQNIRVSESVLEWVFHARAHFLIRKLNIFEAVRR